MPGSACTDHLDNPLASHCREVIPSIGPDYNLTAAVLLTDDSKQLCTNASLHWRGHECREGTMCLEYENPHYGITNYDNIAYAWLTIFQCITLEGWTPIMYMYMDALTGWAILYFVLLVFTGGFFLLNLALAVITEVYDGEVNGDEEEVEETEEMAKEKRKKEAREKRHDLGLFTDDEEESDYEDAADGDDEHDDAKADVNLQTFALAGGGSGESGSENEKEKNQEGSEEQTGGARKKPTKPKAPKATGAAAVLCVKLGSGVQVVCKKVVESPWFGNAFTLFIFVNTIVLAMEYDGMTDAYSDMLSLCNLILSVAFIVEMVLKVIGMGPVKYVADRFNVFDAFVVIVSIGELALANSGSLSALRAFRILRVLKLIRSWTNLQHFLYKIYLTVLDLGNFFFIVCLTIFIFALLGMQMFGGRMCLEAEADPVTAGTVDAITAGDFEIPRHHFDTLLSALVTVFQVLTGEDWNFVMYDSMETAGSWSALYFVLLLVVGNFLVLNLFVAILLTNFGAQEIPPDDFKTTGGMLKGLGGSMEAKREITEEERFWKDLPDKDLPPEVQSRWEVLADGMYARMLAERERVAAARSEALAAEEEARIARRASEERAVAEGRTPSVNAGKLHSLAIVLEPEVPSADCLTDACPRSMPGAAPKPLHEFVGAASLGVFGRENPFRRVCFALVDDKRFDWTIMFFIVVSSCTMIFESPKAMEDASIAHILDIVDTVFTVIFALEMVVKLVAFGLYFEDEDAYFKVAWNCMDGFIVIIGGAVRDD